MLLGDSWCLHLCGSSQGFVQLRRQQQYLAAEDAPKPTDHETTSKGWEKKAESTINQDGEKQADFLRTNLYTFDFLH